MNVCWNGRDIQRHSLHIGNLLGGHVAELIRSAPNGTPPKNPIHTKGEKPSLLFFKSCLPVCLNKAFLDCSTDELPVCRIYSIAPGLSTSVTLPVGEMNQRKNNKQQTIKKESTLHHRWHDDQKKQMDFFFFLSKWEFKKRHRNYVMITDLEFGIEKREVSGF